MQTEQDQTRDICERVAAAAAKRAPLALVGGGTKAFLGRQAQGETLALEGHRGIVNYAPEELILTARAGTRLDDVHALLTEQGQMLAFEPPAYGETATLGGTVAANLSGPRRPYAGAARDFVLGTRIVNGRGEALRFGGEVMKNVAGYDLSRLMCGAMGTLGVLLEVSLKVLPRPHAEITLVREAEVNAAIECLCRWSVHPLPISASCVEGGKLYVRLSGTPGALAQARARIGGEDLADADAYWAGVREHRHPFFAGGRPLWRISLPPAAAPLDLPGEQLVEWGGALRWLKTDVAAETVRAAALSRGGHATWYHGSGHADAPFQPLPDALLRIHKRLKDALDPQRILNRGRMYPDL